MKILIEKKDSIAMMTLARGKVNALNEPMVEELRTRLEILEGDEEVRAIVLTGRGKFFSFGFDIPELLDYSKGDFTRFLEKFTSLYTYLFLYPKPIVAALNGHTIAGGCMLSNACDYRLMVEGKAKISLNEITFGASVMAGSVEILRFNVGSRNAQKILYSGNMYTAREAIDLGLIERVSSGTGLLDEARAIARELSAKRPETFASIKRLVRRPTLDAIGDREAASIRDFVDIWYSGETRENIRQITIHK